MLKANLDLTIFGEEKCEYDVKVSMIGHSGHPFLALSLRASGTEEEFETVSATDSISRAGAHLQSHELLIPDCIARPLIDAKALCSSYIPYEGFQVCQLNLKHFDEFFSEESCKRNNVILDIATNLYSGDTNVIAAECFKVLNHDYAYTCQDKHTYVATTSEVPVLNVKALSAIKSKYEGKVGISLFYPEYNG